MPNHHDEHLEQERLQVGKLAERAILVACHLPNSRFDERDPLGELRSLAETAGAIPVGEMIQSRRRPDAAGYIGSGKLNELKNLKEELNATIIIFDNDLSPSQIRNIEEVTKGKILDRSQLILDIFANRATTNAAKLQVELAQLEYTYPRLKAMWSHFGQIAGGAPVGIGTRGPGETQIETDRRLVQRRKTVLRARLVEVHERRVREVERRKSEHFTVCLVGYTNAGKSTLFNALTEAHGGGGAYADDRLFATLTTRTRRWPLGQGEEVMLSDTVGFVRELPHHLIASFRATLEEALNADLLLVVLDVSDPQAPLQFDVAYETLDSLEADWKREVARVEKKKHGPKTRDPFGNDTKPVESATIETENGTTEIIPPPSTPRRVLILNKIDRLEDQSELAIWHQRDSEAIPISAATGMGVERVLEVVREAMHGQWSPYELHLPLSAGKALSFIEARCDVVERDYTDGAVTFRARVPSVHIGRLRSMGVEITPWDPTSES